MDSRGYSSQLSCQLVWLSGLVPFAQVQQILEEVGQLVMGTSRIWEQNQVHSERLHQVQSHQQAQVNVERTHRQHQNHDLFLTPCVSMDGGMVCIRGEGWKEVKIGLVSDFETDWTGKPVSNSKTRRTVR